MSSQNPRRPGLLQQRAIGTARVVCGRLGLVSPGTARTVSGGPTNVCAVAGHERVVHAIHLLFVADEMLEGGYHSLVLHPLDGEGGPDGLQDRVSPEALPVPATAGLPAQRPHGRTQINVDTLAAKLFADCDGSGEHEILIPGCSHRDASGEGGGMVRQADSECAILETQLREVQSEGAPGISDTSTDSPGQPLPRWRWGFFFGAYPG